MTSKRVLSIGVALVAITSTAQLHAEREAPAIRSKTQIPACGEPAESCAESRASATEPVADNRGAVHAANAPDRSEIELARALFEQGVAATRSSDWSEAESLFRRSLALVPRQSTLYNHARALYELGRPTECLRQLERFDTTAAGKLLNDYVARLRSRAGATLSRLELSIFPEDAAVIVGKQRDTNTGPIRRFSLDPGTHVVLVEAPGYQAYSMVVSLPPGGSIKLTPTLQLQQTLSSAPAASTASTVLDKSLDEEGASPRLPTVVAFGTAGTLAAAGAVTGFLAWQNDRNFRSQCPSGMNCDPALRRTQERAGAYALTTDLLFSASAVALGVGLGLLWFDESEADNGSLELHVAMSPEMTGAVLRNVY